MGFTKCIERSIFHLTLVLPRVRGVCCGHPNCRKEENDARDDDETMNDTDTDDGAAAVSYGSRSSRELAEWA